MAKPAQNPKRELPPQVKQNLDIKKWLRPTMRRAKPIDIPESFQWQLIGVVWHWLHRQLGGSKPVQVSMAQFAEWGECSTRMARTNVNTLVNHGILTRIGHEEGGNQPTIYSFNGAALVEYLKASGCKPSDDLVRGLKYRSDSDGWHGYGVTPGPRKSTPEDTPEVGDTDTPEVNTCFSEENHMDRQNLLPVSGVSSFYRKPSRGRISSSENVSLVPAHQEDAENNRFQAEPSDLTDDHRAYIAVIRETGGTTYGDVAGLSGMGGTRASLTEEELLRRGLIIRAPFGKTVAR